MQAEEPPQRATCLHWNWHHNIWCHHATREQDPTQLVSPDEASKVNECPYERGFHIQKNAHRWNHNIAQGREHEMAECNARLLHDHLPLPHNLQPRFARVTQTLGRWSTGMDCQQLTLHAQHKGIPIDPHLNDKSPSSAGPSGG
jgi:hypothetical protein